MKNKNSELARTLDQYQDEFLQYLNNGQMASSETIRAYASDLNHFTSALLDQNLPNFQDIRPKHIRQYFSELKENGYKNSTLVRKLASLRSFFNYLTEQKEILEESPTRRMKYPSKEDNLPSYLTKEEMNELLQVPNTDTMIGKRDRAILELFYSTGIRVQELHQLEFNQLNLNSGSFRIYGKGDKERLVPIGDEALHWLKTYIQTWKDKKDLTPDDGSSAVIQNKFGNRLSTRSLRRVVSKYAKQIDTDKNVSPHTLRHTFATHMLRNGANLRTLQKFLGHENLHTTEIYTQMNDKHLEETYQNGHPRA